jgi:CheY-like chemotaxis protein
MPRVMLVEDDQVTATLLTVQLRRSDHLVLAVESAESALASIATLGLPDVVVVDIGLPGRDGLTLIDTLRAQARLQSLGVILISAGPPPPPDRFEITERTRFLRKPLGMDDLLAAVDDVYRARGTSALH